MESVNLTINIIYCGIPYSEALSEVGDNYDTHNIYTNKNPPRNKMREQIKHELLRIINDDFYR